MSSCKRWILRKVGKNVQTQPTKDKVSPTLQRELRACSVRSIGEMAEFLGKKYELVNTENFYELLVFLGINYMQRQVAMSLKPVQYVSDNEDGTFSLHFQCFIVSSEVVFTPGVEFVETKPDGSKVQAYITFEANKMMHRQIEPNGRTLNHVYEFYPDKMVILHVFSIKLGNIVIPSRALKKILVQDRNCWPQADRNINYKRNRFGSSSKTLLQPSKLIISERVT